MKLAALALSAGLIAAGSFAAAPAVAQGRGDTLHLIRDAEIEATIRAYSTPIFQAAGLPANNIKVHIVNDQRLNAFVAGGRHMFLFTGTLMRADNPGQVIGVIAHEAGHMVGGHLVRLQREIRDAQIKQIIALILSAGAAVAARDSRVVFAGLGLGGRIIESELFRFTRAQESAADQFALATLDKVGISARGLAEFLDILREQEALFAARQDPYLRTHPITGQRIAEVRQHLARSPLANAPAPRGFDLMHTRMRAKLIGFIRPPEQVIQHFRGKEHTLEARYALAVAYFQDGRLDRGLTFIDGLIKEQPKDAYFHELRGEILFKSGRVREAIASYEIAARLAPQEALIRTGLAQAQLELNDPRHDRPALAHLSEAVRRDDTYPLTWRLLSVAHGRLGDQGNAALAQAELSYLVQDLPGLRAALIRAERSLAPGTPSWQRLQDMKIQVAQILEERRNR
jgi:predicted Zn-dependent protease